MTRVAQTPITPEAPILCPYCGHQYRPKRYTKAGITESLRKHILACTDHPIHELLDLLLSMRSLISSLLSSPLDDVFPKTSPLRRDAEALVKKADKVAAAFGPRKKS